MAAANNHFPLPTREEFLANLQPVTNVAELSKNHDTICGICMNKTVNKARREHEERAVVLHDKHVFGETCIREWLSEANTCPTCRAVLFEDNHDLDDLAFSAPLFVSTYRYTVARSYVEIIEALNVGTALDDRVAMDIYFKLVDQLDELQLPPYDHFFQTLRTRGEDMIAEALETLRGLRLRWYQTFPASQNIPILPVFQLEDEESLRGSDLSGRVRIDFDFGVDSDFFNLVWHSEFLAAFDRDRTCMSVAGHPLALVVLQRMNRGLDRMRRGVVRVSYFRETLRQAIYDPGFVGRRVLPTGFDAFVEHMLYKACQHAWLYHSVPESV